jgi:LmbE family N-acetylglucosaminyl deacetylase
MATVTAPGISQAEAAEVAAGSGVAGSGVAGSGVAGSGAPAGDPHPGPPEDRLIRGQGTTAAQWRAWPGWRDLRAASAGELVPPGRRVVIVAPHPDDEARGAGGLLAATAREGRERLLVAVTDGLASHPGSRLWPACTLGAQRRRETGAALRELDAACPVLRLGIDDGRIAGATSVLAQALAALITPDDVIVSPWRFDGHPDHEAVGRVTAMTAEAVGACHLEAPIWAWHWAAPGDHRVPWPRAAVLHLDETLAQRKRAAAGCFTSQLEPDPSTGADAILPPWALARLLHEREVFFR